MTVSIRLPLPSIIFPIISMSTICVSCHHRCEILHRDHLFRKSRQPTQWLLTRLDVYLKTNNKFLLLFSWLHKTPHRLNNKNNLHACQHTTSLVPSLYSPLHFISFHFIATIPISKQYELDTACHLPRGSKLRWREDIGGKLPSAWGSRVGWSLQPIGLGVTHTHIRCQNYYTRHVTEVGCKNTPFPSLAFLVKKGTLDVGVVRVHSLIQGVTPDTPRTWTWSSLGCAREHTTSLDRHSSTDSQSGNKSIQFPVVCRGLPGRGPKSLKSA